MAYVNNLIDTRRKKMPRPRKCRHVCCLPEYKRFGPLDFRVNTDHYVNMTVDEYEAIRLIDLEGLTQQECSIQMNVARTTVQLIYNDARKKLAEALVNGKVLQIEGGEYSLCDGYIKPCGKDHCNRSRCEKASLTKKISKTCNDH